MEAVQMSSGSILLLCLIDALLDNSLPPAMIVEAGATLAFVYVLNAMEIITYYATLMR